MGKMKEKGMEGQQDSEVINRCFYCHKEVHPGDGNSLFYNGVDICLGCWRKL